MAAAESPSTCVRNINAAAALQREVEMSHVIWTIVLPQIAGSGYRRPTRLGLIKNDDGDFVVELDRDYELDLLHASAGEAFFCLKKLALRLFMLRYDVPVQEFEHPLPRKRSARRAELADKNTRVREPYRNETFLALARVGGVSLTCELLKMDDQIQGCQGLASDCLLASACRGHARYAEWMLLNYGQKCVASADRAMIACCNKDLVGIARLLRTHLSNDAWISEAIQTAVRRDSDLILRWLIADLKRSDDVEFLRAQYKRALTVRAPKVIAWIYECVPRGTLEIPPVSVMIDAFSRGNIKFVMWMYEKAMVRPAFTKKDRDVLRFGNCDTIPRSQPLPCYRWAIQSVRILDPDAIDRADMVSTLFDADIDRLVALRDDIKWFARAYGVMDEKTLREFEPDALVTFVPGVPLCSDPNANVETFDCKWEAFVRFWRDYIFQ